jgi:hypothetical protein
MKKYPVVYGKIEGRYYLSTYKIGAYSIRSLSEEGTFYSDNISLNRKLEFKPTILIRNPEKRFYSGLVQTSLHIYTNKKHKLYTFKVPDDIYQSSFFTRLLNNNWDDIKDDPNLFPYHEFAYKFAHKNNLNILDLDEWKPNGLTEEMKHSNKDRYNELDKVFYKNKLNQESKQKIENYLQDELKFYKLCKIGKKENLNLI